MNGKMKTVVLGFLGLLVFGLPTHAQKALTPAPPPDRAKILDAARKIMIQSKFCAVITIGEDGQPQARTVQPFPPDGGMTVWIGTSPLTRKVAQIRKDPRVTLYYYANLGYVTLLGKAELIDDPAEKQKHWDESWSRLYKDKFRGDDYLLIRVNPVGLEMVSLPDGLVGDPRTWRPLSVDFR